LSSRKKTVQLASISALGTLGDPKAIAVLQKFANARKESREREAADRAIATLRASKKPADEWRDLRNEILELQKANREMRKDLDDLKKKSETSREGTGSEAKPPGKSEKAKSDRDVRP
jgi:HEAT repeat protein